MFEFQQNLSGQLDPLLVDVLDGHQVPLRAATRSQDSESSLCSFPFYKALSGAKETSKGLNKEAFWLFV